MATPKFLKRRITAAVMMVVLQVEFTKAAYASFDTELDAMWNSTQAAAYSNSRGMGVFGGSLAIRTPVRTFNLIAYDPPRLEYGCAGIDVQFGSFSMLNSEQIKTLTRAIVQSAVVYLVHLAIASLCKECENQLTKFMKMAQDIAGAAKNTCALGKQLGQMIAEGVGTSITSKNGESAVAASEAAQAVAKGTVTDTFSSWWDQFSNGSTSQRAASENSSTGYGNLLVNSMLTTGALDHMKTSVLGNDQGAISMMMSAFGTELVATSDRLAATATSTTGSQGQAGATTESVPDQSLHHSLIRLKHIRDGNIDQPAVSVRTCRSFDRLDPKSCQQIDEGPMSFPGVYSYVVKMVAGTQPSASGVFVGIQTGSIAHKIKMASALTADEIKFLRAFSINSGILLTEASGTAGSTYESLVERIINLMADEMTVAIGRAMVQTANLSFPDASIDANKSSVRMPSWMLKNVKDFEDQLNKFMPESQFELLKRQMETLNGIRTLKKFSRPNLSAGRT